MVTDAILRFKLGFMSRRVREKPAGAALIGVGNLKHIDARDIHVTFAEKEVEDQRAPG